MKLHNLKKASNYKVQEWIFKSIPDLTQHQKQSIRNYEIIRWAPFEFMEETETIKNVWYRSTIIILPIVWIILIIGIPVNFIINGYWGYKRLNWFNIWLKKLGI